MTTLTRLYRFSASHRLHVDTLSEAENAALFGKCNNPFGHGHDYVLSITVAGPVDPETGLIIQVHRLDKMVRECVLQTFSHCNMNVDIKGFERLVPTTENVALVIANMLEGKWLSWFSDPARARVSRVHVQETDRNGFEVDLTGRNARPILLPRTESLMVHD